MNELQLIPERIRNICILAHVDHGKTTLSDCLIGSKLRFLDDRDDEQEKLITMKASSIAILFGHTPNPKVKEPQQHLVNLIDSPGHVDFSIEVSSAVSLSDGALVVIDVVEGVSPQTLTVVRQAWKAKVKTCLVLNKIDRLIVARWMDAPEIYVQLQQIIEQINAFVGQLIDKDFVEKEQEDELARGQSTDSGENEQRTQATQDEREKAEEEFLYSPEKGNVAFTSAYDNWAFTLDSVVGRIAKQLGMDGNPAKLKQFLWGKYYYVVKDKKIVKNPPSNKSMEMFAQYVMAPLIAQYRKPEFFSENMLTDKEAERVAHTKIKAFLSKRMPLQKAVLAMVINKLPSPLEAQKFQIDALSVEFKRGTPKYRPVRKAIVECNREEPIVVYVSKMQPFNSRLYDIAIRSAERSEGSQRLIAISRVYSGRLRVGSKVLVFGANHSEETPDVTEAKIPHLFLLMGPSLTPIEEAGPGCVVGIGGLEDILLKTGTISNVADCPNFSVVEGLSKGLVKVAIEPEDLAQS